MLAARSLPLVTDQLMQEAKEIFVNEFSKIKE